MQVSWWQSGTLLRQCFAVMVVNWRAQTAFYEVSPGFAWWHFYWMPLIVAGFRPLTPAWPKRVE